MIKPLTKVTKEGKLYSRPRKVEDNIQSAIGLGIEAIRTRLNEVDPGADEFLKSECLVHLFRESRDKCDDTMSNLLAKALLIRCEVVLQSKVSARLHEDILQEFALILASDSNDELDYYECRFNSAFRTHWLGIVRTEANRRKKVETRVFESAASDTDDEDAHTDEPSCRPTESDDLVRDELLDRLPPDIRKAVVLREMGYEIESPDPTADTVATRCGVTGRTIHNWLNKAKEILPNSSKEST